MRIHEDMVLAETVQSPHNREWVMRRSIVQYNLYAPELPCLAHRGSASARESMSRCLMKHHHPT